MKTVILIILLSLFSWPIFSQNVTKTQQKIKVGIFHNPPIEDFVNGNAIGLYPTLLDEIARKNNWQLEYSFGTWNEVYNNLLNGEIDLLTSIVHLPERDSLVDFNTETIMAVWAELYVASNYHFENFYQLQNKKIGVLKGGAHGVNFKKLMANFNIDITYVDFDDYESLAKAIEQHKIMGGVFMNIGGYNLSKVYTINKSKVVLAPNRLLFATKKGQHKSVLNAIDTQMSIWETDKNSFYYRAIDTWITKYGYSNMYYTYLKWFLLIGLSLSTIGFLWVFTLKRSLHKAILNYKNSSENLILQEKEKIKVENVLSATEQYLQKLFDASTDAIFIHNSITGEILDVNKTMNTMFGYSRNEVISNNIQPFSFGKPPYSKTEADNWMLKAIKKGAQTFEWQCKHKDGNLFWTEVSLKYIDINNEKRILATVRNIEDKKQAELLKLESQEIFNKAFNSSPDAVNINKLEDGLYIRTNLGFTQLTGFTKKEVYGKTSLEINYWVDKHKRTELAKLLNKHGKVSNFEAQFKKKNGEIIDGLMSASIITLKGIPCIVSIMRDITELVQTQKSYQEATNIINRSPSVAFLWRNEENWPVDYVSKNVEELTGYSEEEFLEEKVNYASIIHPDDLKKVAKEVAKNNLENTLQFTHSPYRLKCKNGTYKWISDTSFKRLNNKGEITHYEGVVYDISDKIEYQNNLKLQNEKLVLAGEITHFGFIDWNFITNDIELSTETKKIYQMPDAEKDPIAFMNNHIHPNDLKLSQEGLELAAKGLKKYNADLRILRDDKSMVWVNAQAELIKDKDGNSERLLGTVLDITERKNFEKIIFEKSQFFQKLFDNSPLAFIFVDLNSVIQLWNNAAEKIFGYTAKEALGKNLINLIVSNENKGSINTVCNSGIDTADKYENENENITKSGKQILCKWYNTEIVDEKNMVIGFTSLVEDITDQKIAKAKLQQSTQLLEASQSTAKVGGWELDIATGNLFWTAETYRIHETSPKEFNPTVDAGVNYFLPESRKIITKALEDAVAEGKGYDLELETLTTKGNHITVRTTCKVTFQNGKPIKLTGIFQDISARKKAKKNLFEKEQQMSSIYNTVNDIIFYLAVENEGQYRFTSVNKAFTSAIGVPKEVVIGKLVTEIIPEPSLSLVLKKYKEAITQKTMISWEETTTYPSGEKIGSVSITPVVNQKGVCTHLVGSVHDITEISEANKKIKTSNSFLINTLESMTDAYVSLNKNWEYTYVNKKAGEMLDRKPKDLIGKHIWTEFPNAINQPFYKIYHRAVENQKSVIIQDYFPYLDKWYENKVVPSESGLAVFSHDITEEKENQEIKEIIYDISKFRQTTTDLKTLFSYIKKRLKPLIDTSDLTIALFNEKKESLNIAYRSAESFIFKRSNIPIPKNNSYSGQVFKTKKYFLSTEENSKKLIKKGIVKEFGAKTKCWIGVPLIVKQKIIGVFYLQSYTGESAFSLKNLPLLELVANKLAQIIKEHHDLEEIKTTSNELMVLNKIISSSTSVLSLTKMLDDILEESLHIVGLEGGTICLINSDNTFNLISQREASKETIKDFATHKIKVGSCLCGDSVKNLCPLILNTPQEVLKYATRESLQHDVINFHAAFPFVIKNKPLGVLCVFTRTTKKPSKRSLKLLETLTAQVSLAIQNIQLYETVKKNVVELETKVAERTEDLQQSNHELKEFSQVVSHDLKAPLRAISQLSYWLSQDYADKLDDEGKNQINLIISRVKRLDNLIEGILQYSKASKSREKETNLNLNNLVQDAIELINPPKHVKISFKNKLPNYIADPTRLSQLFQNLIQNAIKYNDKANGVITIECLEKEKNWEFHISDNGIGIEEKYFDRIFQIFQRLTSRDEQEGTGIGLSLAKRIVQIYGGKIWVTSKFGKGSTFYFTLSKQSKIIK